MTKREALHRWLLDHGEWVYANQVPTELQRTVADAQGALRGLCETGRADFRIVGKYQYKGKIAPTPRTGPKEK